MSAPRNHDNVPFRILNNGAVIVDEQALVKSEKFQEVLREAKKIVRG